MPSGKNENRLHALLQSGAKKPGELQKALGVSQPTFSRLVQRRKEDIVVLGATRAIVYAMPRPLDPIGYRIPVFQVDSGGDVHVHGELMVLQGGQYYWKPASGHGVLYHGLPWFIRSLWPEGFAGEAFAAHVGGDGIPRRLVDWNDDHLLVMLSQHGSNLPGNFMLGNVSMAAYLAGTKKTESGISCDQRGMSYPQLAADAMDGRLAEPFAGGQQPKFGALVQDGEPRHVLVKFSRLIDGLEGRRWADLLICEHLALKTMREAGHSAAEAEAFQFGNRAFLEVERFDRAGLFGRFGTVSLRTLEDEFSGKRDDWCRSARRLESQGLISAEDARELCWRYAFGALIANTDQHFGNISLFVERNGRFRLTPAYDMLPMFYRPSAIGEIVHRLYDLPDCHEEAVEEWHSALGAASRFWRSVRRDERISKDFQDVGDYHYQKIKELMAGPRLVESHAFEG